MEPQNSKAFKPFLSIWIAPRRTMRQIMARGGHYQANWLFFLVGACGALKSGTDDNIELWGLTGFLFIAPLLGGLSTIIVNNILVFLLQGIRKWFGGNGELLQTRNAIAWALLPAIFVVPIFILKLNVFGETLKVQDGKGQLQYYTSWGVFVFQSIPWIWTIMLTINTLSVAQHYSRLRAFFHLITAIIILSSPILITLGIYYIML